MLVTAKTLSKMPIELDVSQSTNCCSTNGTIFPVFMGRAGVEKGQHDSFTTPFVVQTIPHSCLRASRTSRQTRYLLGTKMGCSKLFLRQVGELGHGQPSKFLELVTRIMLELAFKRSGRTDSPSTRWCTLPNLIWKWSKKHLHVRLRRCFMT